MPFGSEVKSNFTLGGFLSSKLWSKFASGQAVTSFGFSSSKKYSTGGFLSVQISFWLLLSTALSVHTSFMNFRARRDAKFSETGLKSASYPSSA